MKTMRSAISVFLTALMLLGALAACTSGENIANDTTSDIESDIKTEETSADGIDTDATETIETEETTNSDNGDNKETVSYENVSPLVQNAYSLANGVNAYFEPGSNRNNVIIENQNMTLNYGVSSFYDQQVSYIKNKNGASYIENTFDVFVKMENGNIFYASKTSKPTTMNLYRFGYYMYEVRLEEQDFYNGINENGSFYIEDLTPKAANNINAKADSDGALDIYIKKTEDPFIVFKNLSYSGDTHKYIEITIRSDAKTTRSGSFYFQREGDSNFQSSQASKSFYMNADGEYHTYLISLADNESYSGKITARRLDLDAQKGEKFNIQSIRIIDGDDGDAPALSLARSFFTYSDKMHHMTQVVAHSEVNGIAEIGTVIRIDADTVARLIVKDSSDTLHTTLDTVDWESAEYVGFDIKDAGIFGYIVPKDDTSGKLTVKLENGEYVITQSRRPENGTIIPSEAKTLNANDFYMGERIYTDSSHDFTDFLNEAYCERNPLDSQRFKIEADKSVSDAAVAGYDALRGAYKFTLDGAAGFLIPQKNTPNKHYNVSFTVRGDDVDRKMYFYSVTNTGNLECAVLLDENDMLLPIPLEVGKNFSEATGERNIYNIDDDTYGEVIFPMIINQKERLSYTIVHLYQNWGTYPLKQISWIQFHAPYYHLSTGTTETNCIMPYYATKAGKATLQMLPDHRAWSAPLWENDPQHTSGGSHTMLSYTDSEGSFYSSDNAINVVGAYGPTYADVTMYHTSDDGKIKYTINHMEMPQTDENRGYYEFRYEVIEDLTINDFKKDFSFYSVTDNNGSGEYTKFGYLNDKNECAVTSVNKDSTPVYYALGSECPYFDYFDMVNWSGDDGYVNVSFLIYNAEFIINGERCDAGFVVKEFENRAYLSLDLGKTTLKAGDTFVINAIIMPWGSQESEYPADAPDYNVRNVRENTLLDPVKLTPVENCEVIESVYLPRALSTDGKTATFTVSGGHNNIAVRVYGFEKLTSPKVYEKIGEDWVEVVLNSSETPDKMGNYHYYDGYNVYYDGNGTYSYSFVTTIDNGSPRTFKVEAFEDFKKWPEIENSQIVDPIDLYLDHKEISEVILYPDQFSNITMGSEEFEFISFYGNSHIERLTESYFYAYQNGEVQTGGLLVMKYRLPASNPDKISNVEFYTSTVNPQATSNADSYWVTGGLVPDGQWHVLIVDIASFNKSSFAIGDDGAYTPQYIRVDPFNSKVSNDTRIDIAFIGMADTREEIFELCTDMESVTLCKNSSTNLVVIDPSTGNVIDGDDSPSEGGTEDSSGLLNLYITPTEIEAAIEDVYQFAKIEQKNEGGVSYISFYGNSHKDFLDESYFSAYTGGTKVTGAYLAIKYRLPSTNTESVNNIEFYTSTTNSVATAQDSFYVSSGLINDGEWHVLIVDLASFEKSTFTKNTDGEFVAKYVRVDAFNGKFSSSTRIDIAYIAMDDTLQDLIGFNSDLETVSLAKKNQISLTEYETATGKPVGDDVMIPDTLKLYFSGTALKAKAESNLGNGIGKVTVSENGSYTTFNSKAGAGESYILLHHNTKGDKEIGQYLAIKYRTSLSGERFEVYASTTSASPSGSGVIYIGTADRGYINDGQWHLLIIDLSTLSCYTANADGGYYPMHFRFDVFNITQETDENSVDIGYIGIGTDLSDLLSFETELDSALVYDADGLRTVSIE